MNSSKPATLDALADALAPWIPPDVLRAHLTEHLAPDDIADVLVLMGGATMRPEE